MNRKDNFIMLSYKNRYEYTGIIQKVSFESMYKAFKTNFIEQRKLHLNIKMAIKSSEINAKTKVDLLWGKA
jgi:hypothetical protein